MGVASFPRNISELREALYNKVNGTFRTGYLQHNQHRLIPKVLRPVLCSFFKVLAVNF